MNISAFVQLLHKHIENLLEECSVKSFVSQLITLCPSTLTKENVPHFISILQTEKRFCLQPWQYILFHLKCKSKYIRSPKKTRKAFYNFLYPFLYTVCTSNNVNNLSVGVHLYVFYVCIKCLYVCKWAYLVFPSVSSMLDFQWTY